MRRLPALSWDLRDSADRSACPVGGPPGADAFQSCLAPAVRLPESFPGRIAPTALERTRSPAGIRAAYAVVTREHRIGVRLRAGVRRGGLLSDRAGGESGLPVQQQEGPRPEQHPRDRPGEPVVVGPGRSATSLLPGAPDDGNPSDEAAPQRIGRRVRPSAGPDLGAEAGRVPLDGVNGDPEAAGDLRGQVLVGAAERGHPPLRPEVAERGQPDDGRTGARDLVGDGHAVRRPRVVQVRTGLHGGYHPRRSPSAVPHPAGRGQRSRCGGAVRPRGQPDRRRRPGVTRSAVLLGTEIWRYPEPGAYARRGGWDHSPAMRCVGVPSRRIRHPGASLVESAGIVPTSGRESDERDP